MKCSFLRPPQTLTLGSFGLSISETSVRVAKLVPKKIGCVPAIVDDVVIQETCNFFSGTEDNNDCAILKKTLVELRKKHKIKFAQVAIPEEHTYIFRILIPSTDIYLINDFILNNIDQHIPLTANDVFFDYKILETQNDNSNLSVVVTAIPKNIVQKYSNLLESVGIHATSFEPETHAIARCVIGKNDMSPYIIINVDRTTTNISIVESGLVQYTQTIPVTIYDFYNNTNDGAAALLRESINKVIIYWFTSKESGINQEKIQNIILTGEGVDHTDLVNFLESNLFVNVTIANVWNNCFDLHIYVPNISKKESLKYATPIGLAMFKIK